MKLSELLQNRSGEVYRINESETVVQAATAMTNHKIGALIVENDAGEIVGILSERDIVVGVSEHTANLQQVKVSEMMTRELIRCQPDNTVNEAMGLMTNRRVRHLPVFEGERMVGLVSIGDLVKYRIMEVQSEADAMRAYIAS